MTEVSAVALDEASRDVVFNSSRVRPSLKPYILGSCFCPALDYKIKSTLGMSSRRTAEIRT